MNNDALQWLQTTVKFRYFTLSPNKIRKYLDIYITIKEKVYVYFCLFVCLFVFVFFLKMGITKKKGNE